MSEHDLGLLGLQETMELLVMSGVHDGLAVKLSGENGAGLENFAGFLGFGNADRTGVVTRFVRPIASVQVKQNNFVTQIGVTSDGAAATIFRIAGMPAGDDHFELRLGVWSLLDLRLGGRCRQGQPNRNGGAHQAC